MVRSVVAVLAVGFGVLLSVKAIRPVAAAVPENAPPAAVPESAPSQPHAVSFKKDVMPILSTSCSTVSCHGGAHPPDIDPLSDPSKVRAALVGVASEERSGHAYVTPGAPEKSWLVSKIDGRLNDAECTDHDCGVQMPARNPELPEASRAIIRTWIAEGARDN